MRSTLSDHAMISLISFAARCFATFSTLLRSRPIQSKSSVLRAMPTPFSLTILTRLPAGSLCILSAS